MTNYDKITQEPTKAEEPEVDTRPKYEVSYNGNLNLRKTPGGEILFELKHGEQMFFVGDEDEWDGEKWLKVEARGKTGFVMDKYVEPLDPEE